MNAHDAICASDLPGACDEYDEFTCDICGAVLLFPADPSLCGDCEAQSEKVVI